MNPGVTHEATATLPPQNIEAEETLLGALMLASSGPVVDDVVATGLQPADFYRNTSNGRIYTACLELHRAGTPIDLLTVVDQLQRTGHLDQVGGIEKIRDLAISAPVATNAAHHARLVRDLSAARALVTAGQRIAALGYNRPGDVDDLLEQARTLLADATDRSTGRTDRLHVETWAEFEQASHDRIPTIVDGLWPEAALGFVAAPPKKGKTWIGLSLALSVATGKPFLNHFQVPKPQPVIYLALEGHRAAIRTRVGALARGLGVDPDPNSGDLDLFRPVYKPRGLNLADPAWIRDVRAAIQETGAKLVIVDVLRAAATMKENDNDAFNTLRLLLDPISQDGCAIALLHHFGKLTEISKDRTPGERMSGAGAMYGAMDVGLFITGADKEARELRVEFELRDLATPDPVGVKLTGDGTGDNGGFVYRDTARWEIQEHAPDADEAKAPAQEIYDWICEQGGDVDSAAIRHAFEITLPTLKRREPRLDQLGVEIIPRPGKATIYRVSHDPQPAADTAPSEQLPLAAEPVDNPAPDPESDPESATPKDFRGQPIFGVEPHNHAPLPDTPKDPENDDPFGVDLAQTNGFHTPIPRTSPTGMHAALDAPAHPENQTDPLFTTTEQTDLTTRLADAQPDPEEDPWLT